MAEEPVPSVRRIGPFVAAFTAIAIGAVIAVAFLRPDSREGNPPVKAGWKRETVRDQGFAISLPPGWQSTSTTSVDAASNSLKDANPQLAALVRDQLGSSLSSLIKYLAFDTRSTTLAQQFATNMNVVVVDVSGAMDVDGFFASNLSGLRKTPGIANLRSGRLTLADGDAALVTLQLTVNAPGGAQQVAISQYLLVHHSDAASRGYIVSFSTLPSHVGAYSTLFREIIETLRFV